MVELRKVKGIPVHGWLAVDKPAGMSSARAVSLVKRFYKAQKTGHGGTLDPLANGVLPMAFGEATKTMRWLVDSDKEYVCKIAWGVSTDSQDRQGSVIARSDLRPSIEAIRAALQTFQGRIQQIPPHYSAIKLAGRRACDRVRDGESPQMVPRDVFIYESELLDVPDCDHALVRIVCGKGFYIRAMVRDLAAAMGVEGHVASLRRTRVGEMQETDAMTLDTLQTMSEAALFEKLLPVETALRHVPRIDVDSGAAAAIRQGREVVLPWQVAEPWRKAPDDRTALAMTGNMAVAIGEIRADRFFPARVFRF